MPPDDACPHHDFTKTPTEYFEWHRWAERRYLYEDAQKCCPKCGYWLFEEEMNDGGDTPEKLFVDILQMFEDILYNEVGIKGIAKKRKYNKLFKGLRERAGMFKWR